MPRSHHYQATVTWTGNRGTGTSGYKDYGRDHEVSAPGCAPIAGSADRTFHGDRDRWNPEMLLVAALSQCHLLSYLHVCADAGVVVTGYSDDAEGTMGPPPAGGGNFPPAVRRPRAPARHAGMTEAALRLHEEASARCFIAASVNFPVRHEPEVTVAPG